MVLSGHCEYEDARRPALQDLLSRAGKLSGRIVRVAGIGHASSTRAYLVASSGLEHQVGVHSACECNEIKSLLHRHMVVKDSICFNAELWEKITTKTLKFYSVKLETIGYRAILDKYSGTKKRTYWKAREELLTIGLVPQDFIVRMFIKIDKMAADKIRDKAPRAIQYRSPKFNLAFSKYIHPFEEFYYSYLTYGNHSGTRCIAKGLNPIQRAELVIAKAECYTKPRYVLLDHSAFDSSVNVDHLRSSHKKFMKVFGGGELWRLCQAQIDNVGYTRTGAKYKTRGTRMSGDPDTGLSNSTINCDVIYGLLMVSGVRKYDFLVDGDDSILIVEAEDLPKLSFSVLYQLGFESKVAIVDELEKAEFCQSRIIMTSPPRFVRNPCRVLSHSVVCCNTYSLDRYFGWMKAVGMCEVAVHKGVPILQHFGALWMSIEGQPLFDRELLRRMTGVLPDFEELPVTAEARLSMHRAFGITPELQVLIENSLTFEHMRFFRKFNSAAEYFNGARTSARRQRREYGPESGSCSWWCGCSSGHTALHELVVPTIPTTAL